MTAMTPAQRFAALPRAARWGVVAALALGAYFLIVEPVLDARANLESRADAAATRLALYARQEGARTRAAETIRRGQERFAAVAFPGGGDQAAEALNKAVSTVLDENRIGPRVLRSRTVPITGSPLEGVLRPGERLERRIVDIQFDSPPEQAAAVLAALEQQPEVTEVSRVQLDRQPEGRTLRAAITVETWARVRKESR